MWVDLHGSQISGCQRTLHLEQVRNLGEMRRYFLSMREALLAHGDNVTVLDTLIEMQKWETRYHLYCLRKTNRRR